MVYSLGGKVSAVDYNNFIGRPASGTNALSKFTSEATATGKVGAILGVGYGRWGYGQTTPALTNISSGDLITAAHWDNLYDAIEKIRIRQGTTVSGISAKNKGEKVRFDSGKSSAITSINTNKFNATGRTYTAVLSTSTRTTAWSTTIDTIFTVTFGSGDLARYWFNSGSEILIRTRHNLTTLPQDQSWNTFLSTQVGDISLGAEGTRQSNASAAGGTIATTIGYWDLSTSYQNIFTRTAGTGVYSVYSGDLVCTVQAMRNGAANVSGAGDNGSSILIKVTLTDNHTGFQDLITGNGTVTQIYGYRSTSGFTPASPSSVTVTDGY